jgi:hypothetical protein
MKNKKITKKEEALKTIMEVCNITERRAEFVYNEIERQRKRSLYKYMAYVSAVSFITTIIIWLFIIF